MSLRMRVAAFWRDLFRRSQVDRDFAEELGAYVELLAAEKIRAGSAPAEARRAARIEAGGVESVRDDVRDVRHGALLATTLRDAALAVRALAKHPVFAAAAIATLALAIGANTAMLSVVDAVLLRPLPYADPARLVVILNQGRNPVGPASYLDWQRQSRSFSSLGAAESWSANVTTGDRAEKVPALRLTSGVLPMLGVAPALGRVWSAEADAPGSDHVVVLSDRLWDRLFARDRGVIGRQVRLSGESYTVIGVMPPGFGFAPFWVTNAGMWAPLALGPRASDRGGWSLRVFARLATGVTLEQARRDIGRITAEIERTFPGSNQDVQVMPLTRLVTGDVRTPLVVILGAVAFVLLIACANVAHMLLARATDRRREIAVRTALGASRARTVRQLLTESVVLALAGAVAGVLLAAGGVRLLLALGGSTIPRLEGTTVDARVLAATMVLSLATAVLFGLAPALRASSPRLTDALKEGSRGSTEGGGRSRFRRALIASECALALMLLVGAGLMTRSFAALQAIDPGFDPHGLLAFEVSVNGTAEAASGVRAAFYDRVVDGLRAMPGVASAAAINHVPIVGDAWGFPYWVEGRPAPQPGDVPAAVYRVVTPGYFGTMRIALVKGRDFAANDRGDAPRVVIVNRWMAEHTWPGEDAIGKRISLHDPATGDTWLTVVGVTANVVQERWSATTREEVYLPLSQSSDYLTGGGAQVAYLSFVVRAGCAGRGPCDASTLAPGARRLIASIDRAAPVSDLITMDRVARVATARPRFYFVLLAVFAAVALALAAVGIYGVTSYAVSRRTHEIGLRMALGAQPGQVLRGVVGEGLAVALAGVAAGVVGALWLTRLLAGVLYGVQPRDPATFAVVAVLLCLVASVASWIPARRATRIAPLSALRGD